MCVHVSRCGYTCTLYVSTHVFTWMGGGDCTHVHVCTSYIFIVIEYANSHYNS